MDEPFSAVDATTERAIVEVLHELRDRGRTAVVVHHDLQTVQEYFDHLLLLNTRVVAFGWTEDVFTTEHLNATYGGKLTLRLPVTKFTSLLSGPKRRRHRCWR